MLVTLNEIMALARERDATVVLEIKTADALRRSAAWLEQNKK